MVTKYISMENRSLNFKNGVRKILTRMGWNFDEHENTLCINIPRDEECLFDFVFVAVT